MKILNKILLSLLFLISLSPNVLAENDHELNLMPFPKEISVKEGKFRIDRDFSIEITGNPNARIYGSAARFIRRLDERTGLFFKRGFAIHDSIGLVGTKAVIEIQRPGDIKLGEDESYKLVIDENNIRISAETDLGAIHSLQTLLQLLSIDTSGYYFPAIEINDAARFKWRGLMIDVARHFMPVNVIKRNLDGMAAVKLNVLHLHLSDDQGFRVECKTFPKLQELGSNGFYYTQEQIKDIIKYAGERGIRVYPEFDMPGHATSWFVGYPEYASMPEINSDSLKPYNYEYRYGVLNPTLNPTIEKTYQFLDKFFKEMASLFPDEYMHIGGDENNGVQWNANNQIQRFKEEKGFTDNSQLQSYFVNRVQKILSKYGKKMVGWDEIFTPDIPNNIVIQSWRGTKALIQAAKRGYQGILSNGYYIDLMQPASYHYLNDPVPDSSDLTSEEESHILGGEATMWSEWVTKDIIDSRIWPRTAAIAERFWSPRDINDVDEMYKRLDHINFLLERYGLENISFQPIILRVLTNNQPIEPLKILVDVVRPLEEYERDNLKKYGGYKNVQYSPHTLVVDAAVADPKYARDINKLIDKFLQLPEIEESNKIKDELIKLQNNHNQLLLIINNSPVLKEIEPLSENLSKLAGIGLEALAFIESKTKADTRWNNKANLIVDNARISYGRVQIAIVEAVKKLVDKAG